MISLPSFEDDADSTNDRSGRLAWLGAVALLSAVLFSCAPMHANDPSTNAGVAGQTAEDKATQSDSIADDAEAHLSLQTMSDSYGKFSHAVELNPENKRAVFWSAVLKPMLQMKGILKRVHPIYRGLENGEERYFNVLHKVEEAYTPAVKLFLFDGPEDITDTDMFQEWMDGMDASAGELRSKLRGLRDDTDISISIAPDFVRDLNMRRLQSSEAARCSIAFGPIRYHSDIGACDSSGPMQVGLNHADFDALLTTTSYFQLDFEFMAAYRINPLALLAPSKETNNVAATEKAMREFLGNGRLGQKRHKNPFSSIRDMTSDLAAALRFIVENQRELCPTGYFSPDNRKGYLISVGYCLSTKRGPDGEPVESEEVRSLRVLETMLMGQPVDDVVDGKTIGSLEPLRINEVLPNQLSDFGPFRYDECGDIVDMNIKPIQALFVSGDYRTIYDHDVRIAREECAKKRSQEKR